jgi:menaquinol-cytochrome c reductase iron-sulfur subunit
VPDDRKPKKPKTTAELNIPGAYEGETVTRRRFMTGTVHTAGAIAGAAIVLPAVGVAAAPMF